MAIAIPTALIEFILFGPLDDRRQLQDSPILGDVWIRYGAAPAAAIDLLIAPYAGDSSCKVAREINHSLPKDGKDRHVAYLQGFVAAQLTFSELVRFVVPRTYWWNKGRSGSADRPAPAGGVVRPALKSVTQLIDVPTEELSRALGDVFALAKEWRDGVAHPSSSDGSNGTQTNEHPRLQEIPPLQRFVALTGLLLWASKFPEPKPPPLKEMSDFILDMLNTKAELAKITRLVASLRKHMLKQQPDEPKNADVWEVSINRTAMPALTKSIAAVKADAARTLFTVDCSKIAWAVIDSGIDGEHPAFFDTNAKPKCRIKQSFDFRNFRKIVSLSNLVDNLRHKNAAELKKSEESLVDPPDFDADLRTLAKDAEQGRPTHWELVRKFVEIKPGTRPTTNHGTHVAGILGANKIAAERAGAPSSDAADGMCPDIGLFDFRVLAPNMRDSEFAIIAVLQFIRYLNSQDNFLKIHGANLSISIPHDVRNYACGRTPICVECERLIESGVVVIAAAGNHGYKTFQTNEGAFDSYAAFSITDPGNADQVLTVGSTHRFWPHTYGVSFFSSRGPTGDGRMKPDLVAPGERIRAPFPNQDWGDLDGTSMAAPHVSGAAAMLMARYSELIGRPRRIKQILCESATNLERERSFQGYGMLDVLRAFQSI